MTRRMRLLPVVMVSLAILVLAVAARGPRDRWTDERVEERKQQAEASQEVVELDEAAVFFEFNSTDLDLGLHLFFDGPGWQEVKVRGPNGLVFDVKNKKGLNEIGSTEVFTESAEPPLDEANLAAEMAAFQARFPEGEYTFTGRTIDDEKLEGSAMLTHALPAPPELIFPDPEAEENLADPADTVIEWADASLDEDPAVARFELIVEFEDEVTEEVFVFTMQIPADPENGIYSVRVPEEYFDALEERDGEYKAEVISIADGRNASIVENEFELDDEE